MTHRNLRYAGLAILCCLVGYALLMFYGMAGVIAWTLYETRPL